jgi:parallel beta-helix repeat protein
VGVDDSVNKKILTIFIMFLLFFTSIIVLPVSSLDTINITSEGITLYVDDDFNESTPGWNVTHFNIIKDAINASSDNDTVFVHNGTYFENIGIAKSIDLVGEDKNTTVIDGRNLDSTVVITANQVNISGFTIQNGRNYGIMVRSSYNLIKNNIFRDNVVGICLYFSGDESTKYNNITNNHIFSNNRGISVYDSEFTTLFNNIVEMNDIGIKIHSIGSECIKVTSNIIRDNNIGIDVCGSKDIYSYNLVTSNDIGFMFYFACFDNEIINNQITLNDFGLLTLEPRYGYMFCTNYIHYNNFINNDKIYYKYINFNTSSYKSGFYDNYWDRPRFLPKYIPYFNFDFHPAKEPYDIDTGWEAD